MNYPPPQCHQTHNKTFFKLSDGLELATATLFGDCHWQVRLLLLYSTHFSSLVQSWLKTDHFVVYTTEMCKLYVVGLYSSPTIDVEPYTLPGNLSDFVKMSLHCWPTRLKNVCYFLDAQSGIRLVILNHHYQSLRVVHFEHYRIDQSHYWQIF